MGKLLLSMMGNPVPIKRILIMKKHIAVMLGSFIVAGHAWSISTENPSSAKNQILLAGTPLSSAALRSRAITAENQTGAKGQGGQTLNGRKGLPCLWEFKKDQVYTFAEIEGPGMVRHIWITVQNTSPEKMRNLILRFYWDGQETPSVEAPLSDFFGVSHGRTAAYESAFITMPEGKGFNCYFPMPFTKKAKLTVTNETGEDAGMFFYQVDYTLGDEIDEECPYFHAQFRRDLHTTMYEDYVILDGVEGRGRYLGANIGLIDRFTGKGVWWGEGEVKMYLDGDKDFPTICGTGSEDYAGTGWGLGEFHAQEMGAPLAKTPYYSFYRFHVRDPVYFNKDIKVTIQQIGYDGSPDRAGSTGLLGDLVTQGYYKKDRLDSGQFERVDDMCSTAYWYQTLPTRPFPPFPDRELRSALLTGKAPGENTGITRGLGEDETLFEGESLSVVGKTAGEVSVQMANPDFIGEWSGNAHLWWNGGSVGDALELTFPVSQTGEYEIYTQLTTATDYAIVELLLDGKKLGKPIDLYSEGIRNTGDLKLGSLPLTEGGHRLKVIITGRNPKGVNGYLFGIDYLCIKKQRM